MKTGERGFTVVEVAVSVAIMAIITGIILGTITYFYRAAALADNTMMVSARSSQALAHMREDLLQTSRNFAGNYAPFIDTDSTELRFRKIESFSAQTGRATYENFYTCYYLDTSKDVLYKRYRDLSGTLLSNPAPHALASTITAFTPVLDTEARTVTITLTTTTGDSERSEDASITRTVVITPFNID